MLSKALYPTRQWSTDIFHWLILHILVLPVIYLYVGSVEEVDFALISSNLSSRNGISVREVLILKIADLRTSIPFDIIAIAIQTSSQAELLTFFPRSAKIICLWSGLQMAMRW